MSAILARSTGQKLVHVPQGEFSVSEDPNILMTTILGSCVATALHDPVAKVGGLNHFLLPGDRGGAAGHMSYGVNAMELLINALLKHGAQRHRLQAKLFGGAQVVRGLSNVGESNSNFARSFLADEGIACVGESLGGSQGRRIRYWPATGKAQQMLLAEIPASTPSPSPSPTPSAGNDVELF